MSTTNVVIVVAIAVAVALIVIYFLVRRNWHEWLSKTVSNLWTNHRPVVASIAIFIFAFIVTQLLYLFAQYKTDGWFITGLKFSTISIVENESEIEPYDYRSNLQYLRKREGNDTVKQLKLMLPKTENCRVERMYQQLTDVSFQAYNHIQVARECMVQNYLCTSMSAVFYTLGLSILFFITRTGLDRTPPWIVASFVSCTSVATLFFTFTNIFKLEDNVNKNLELYLEHVNLEQEMRSDMSKSQYLQRYTSIKCTDMQLADSLNWKGADAMIEKFDKRMGEINRIELGFNPSGVLKLRETFEQQSK